MGTSAGRCFLCAEHEKTTSQHSTPACNLRSCYGAPARLPPEAYPRFGGHRPGGTALRPTRGGHRTGGTTLGAPPPTALPPPAPPQGARAAAPTRPPAPHPAGAGAALRVYFQGGMEGGRGIQQPSPGREASVPAHAVSPSLHLSIVSRTMEQCSENCCEHRHADQQQYAWTVVMMAARTAHFVSFQNKVCQSLSSTQHMSSHEPGY
jgi:hypothetical protein